MLGRLARVPGYGSLAFALGGAVRQPHALVNSGASQRLRCRQDRAFGCDTSQGCGQN